MSWLTWLGSVLASMFQSSIATLGAYWAGKKEGRKDAELEQKDRDIEALRSALDARESVDDSPDSVLDDSYNRGRLKKG